ncbi:hypothetical protein ATK36_1641 [Amycolatopsis sulphurea]|uniref:Uncharacterized protein n=1 Tax=Amycolatopsis sulphurea TaxID=76022 RepID=A0A2A9F824_9PSEU|nr:hypothetical protein [Amycolatopsis sulphurea]PFG46650.1 hypothetical protein ATK36_1641 [Amycolatopsis sulphurea]
MNSSDKSMLGAAVFLCAGVPVICGLVFGWPLWLLFAVPLPVIPGVVYRRIRARLEYERELDIRMSAQRLTVQPPPPAPEPVRHQQTSVPVTALPSAQPDYRFVFSATVYWRFRPDVPQPVHGNPAALAIEAIVAQAKDVTAAEHPLDHQQVRHRLDSLLGQPRLDRTGAVEASAAGVRLELEPADRERLEMFARTRKDAEVWDYQRHREQDKRRYLGEDVLRDTGSAVVWWLSRHENDVQTVVQDIPTLANLAGAANNQWTPPAQRSLPSGGDMSMFEADFSGGSVPEDVAPPRSLSDVVEEMVGLAGLESGSPERELFVDRVVDGLRAAGKTAAAQELHSTFSTLDPELLGDSPGQDSAQPVAPPGEPGSAVEVSRAEAQEGPSEAPQPLPPGALARPSASVEPDTGESAPQWPDPGAEANGEKTDHIEHPGPPENDSSS